MGSSIRVHVGAYLECRNEMYSSSIFVSCCTNRECRQYHKYSSGNFCPDCGSNIGTYEKPVKKSKVPTWDFIESIEESLFNPMTREDSSGRIDIYISNRHHPGDPKRKIIDGDTEDTVESISAENIKSEVDHFCQVHGKDIEEAKRLYGEESVSIRWGYVAYWI